MKTTDTLKFLGTVGLPNSTSYVKVGQKQYDTESLPKEVVAEIERRYDLHEELVAALKEAANASATEYSQGEDDVGGCIHCQEVSYRPHRPDCLITKLKELLKKVGAA